MKQVENFTFNDVVLYAKGWYYKEGNTIVQDLYHILGEIYLMPVENEKEVARIMLIALDEFLELRGVSFDSNANGKYYNGFSAFHNAVERKMHSYNVVSHDMATILVVLEVFNRLGRDEIKLKRPVYGKKMYFRMPRPISTTYKEMNKIAIEMFGE